MIAGGPDESVLEPRWDADGALWFVSDRTDWWNLYRYTPGTDIATIVRIDAEIGVPHVAVRGRPGTRCCADGSVVFARLRRGYDSLARRAPDGTVTDLDTPFSRVTAVRAAADGTVLVVAGSPTREPGVHRVDPAGGVVETLRPPRDLGVDAGFVSVPEHITFPSDDGRTALRAVLPTRPPRADRARRASGRRCSWRSTAARRPRRRRCSRRPCSTGPAAGSPSSTSTTAARPATAARSARSCSGSGGSWTSPTASPPPATSPARVGSTASGSPSAAARRAASPRSRRWPAPTRRSRRAPTTSASPTSKRWPATRTSSRAATSTGSSARTRPRATSTSSGPRSTTSTASTRPLIVLQGSEDAIVPPAQSETIVDALRDRKVPVAYLLFDGEQHGFRRAENIRSALDAELSFYAQVLGLRPARRTRASTRSRSRTSDRGQVGPMPAPVASPTVGSAAVRPPLMLAASGGYVEIVDLLINKGVDIEKTNNCGANALMYGSGYSHNRDTMELLLKKTSDVNHCDNNGSTALFWAVDEGNILAANLLLENGANVNVADNTGRTCLMYASYKGNESLINMLIRHGADVNAKDCRGITAFKCTYMSGRGSTESRRNEVIVKSVVFEDVFDRIRSILKNAGAIEDL